MHQAGASGLASELMIHLLPKISVSLRSWKHPKAGRVIIDIAEAAERGEAERILAENGPADFPGILPLFLIKEYSGLDEEPDEAVRKKG